MPASKLLPRPARFQTFSEVRALRVGARVTFRPLATSRALYSYDVPADGTGGAVTTVPFPGGRKRTFLPGPGGGLLFVRWDDGSTCGVSALDVTREG